MSVKNRNSIVTDGLVFYVDAGNSNSYSGSGTDWNDLKSTYDSTLANNPVYSSTNGGSLDFDGTDDRADVPMSDVYTYMGGFTISYWIKTTQTSYGVPFGVASGNTGAPNFFSEGFSVTLNNDGTSAQSGYTRLFLRDEGPSGNGSSLNTMIASFPCGSNDGSWHHVTIAYDNLSTPVMTAYVDGVSKTVTYRVGSRDQINLSYVNNPSQRNPCLACANGRDEGKSNFLDGSLAAFSFYDRVLSSSEVTQNYNALKNRFI